MTVFLVVLVLVLVVAAAGGLTVVTGQRAKFAKANQVVPGLPSRAPAAWAGAHSPEALLHRRLRDAVAAMRANPAVKDGWAIDSRVALEQHALAVDDRLVAVAALPASVRGQPLAAVADAVAAVEAAVASLATAGPEVERRDGLYEAMAQVQARVAQLAEG
jgi:hypothetical protein